ncbi:MAG: phage replisome organizer N-terminal domain-containing protein [Bacilli bacterium]
MAENENDKKFFWLKLKRDFFKRHDITIVEALPNGKDYILFYLKLLCESVDHEGNLRFSDTIPYNEQMLSALTNTNIDVVRAAMKIFIELKMIDILEDRTIYMAEIDKMLGTETYWAERKRIQRNTATIGQCPTIVQRSSNDCPTCPSKSNILDIYKDKDNKNTCLFPDGNDDSETKKNSIDTLKENLFEIFWKEYPRKESKKNALKVYLKYLKTNSEDKANDTSKTILDGLHKSLLEWKSKNTEIKYIPLATTWLNGERWKDETNIENGGDNFGQPRIELKGITRL